MLHKKSIHLIVCFQDTSLTFPSRFNLSLRYLDVNIADTRTLNAPNGVTSDAGANAYAVKFAASPIPTVTFILEIAFLQNYYRTTMKETEVFHDLYVLHSRPAHHTQFFKYPKPPDDARTPPYL